MAVNAVRSVAAQRRPIVQCVRVRRPNLQRRRPCSPRLRQPRHDQGHKTGAQRIVIEKLLQSRTQHVKKVSIPLSLVPLVCSGRAGQGDTLPERVQQFAKSFLTLWCPLCHTPPPFNDETAKSVRADSSSGRLRTSSFPDEQVFFSPAQSD